jgi:Putative DNA-binding domain
VDIELPDDPEAEIQALLSQGEGQQIEFKRQLPQDTTESKRTVFKTVAAFANGYGGNMVFGIEKDEATVCGLDGIDSLGERTGWRNLSGRPMCHRRGDPAELSYRTSWLLAPACLDGKC